MKTHQKTTTFDRVVVRPIANGYLVEIEGANEDFDYCFPTYRHALRWLKTLEHTSASETEYGGTD